MTDIATGSAAGVASEAAKCGFNEVKLHFRYVINYKKMVEEFKEKTMLLKVKRESVQMEIDHAERNMGKILLIVKFWCEQVDKTIDEEVKTVKDLEEKAKAKCFLRLCPVMKSRYQLSKKAVEDVTAFDKLLQQGRFDKVAVLDAPKILNDSAPENFKVFDSRKEVFNKIIEALKDPTIYMIGVHGPAGVGKTTLVYEVARKVKKDTFFGSVVIGTVTQTPQIEEIQGEISEQLGLKLEDKTIQVRASWLSGRLKKEEKILVVLDDLWAGLDLKQVGIPSGDHEECKILLTSRDKNVLTSEMDAKRTFEIGALKEEEAWDLLKTMAENDYKEPELQSIATEAVKRCGGLPLAISTLARTLRNKESSEWKDALLQIQGPSPSNSGGIPANVSRAIELSFEYLPSEELKHTFECCCLLNCMLTFKTRLVVSTQKKRPKT